MKFQVIAQIKCKLTGIDLDDEYDRLGFEKRPEKFPAKQITIDVSKEFVREHRDLFGGESTA